MKTFDDVFVGVVDILGYDTIEKKVSSYPNSTTEALLKRVFTSLDQTIDTIRKTEKVELHRYGDGYVFYTHEPDIALLSELIRKASGLLALALSQHIPLRVAITQSSVNVDKNDDGLTFSGKGWEQLRKIEKAMDWMGGFLYLPNYNGFHHETIVQLVQHTDLIIEQNLVQGSQFIAPVKDGAGLIKDKCWYLNWYKVLRQPKDQADQYINSWWNQIDQTHNVNDSDEVRVKQRNTIVFADYARKLLEASNLVYHSDIHKLPIERITG